MKSRHLFVLTFLLFTSSHAFATWTLDNTKSSLNFVSTKAIDIAEVHHFSQLAGQVSNKGKAVLTVELSSVATGIPIRDERMMEMLFETKRFPLATVRSKIDMKIVDAIPPGGRKRMAVEIELDLHGVRIALEANIIVVKLNEKTLMVSSADPVIVNAAAADLSGGIEALREVASLPSIGNAVPVSFILTFEQTE
jgi:polyisoprenoid-binding protein YceI